VAGFEIFGDPGLKKVFSRFIVKTLRHAKNVTEIRIRYRRKGDNLILVYEDNGSGIPEKEKPGVFIRTLGTKNFGPFFVHDFPEGSGISLLGNGEPGKGVRYEMTVPEGWYRIVPAGT
jgi:sensor histidine kinase regulating citrate/malate metabolism